MSDASEPKQAGSTGTFQDGRPASESADEVKKAETGSSSTESEKCECDEK
jgi:hypothetical protein